MNLADAGFDRPAPPEELSEPLQALWWLKKGGFTTGLEWDKAHSICQRAEGKKPYDYVHALAHWIEGDKWNSDYWYGQVGEKRQSTSAEKEWAHIAASLSADA